jgi:nucleotide-binding universal stress UspA family protein
MSYETVMICIGAGLPERRMAAVRKFADRCGSAVIGLAFAPRPSGSEEFGGEDRLLRVLYSEVDSQQATREAWFRAAAGPPDRVLELRCVMEPALDALVRESRCADLVVLGSEQEPGDAYVSLAPGNAVLALGRPALIIPDHVDEVRAENVVIAWTDTREARRALSDALPLLRLARSVSLVEACEPDRSEQALRAMNDVQLYLCRHGVVASVNVIMPTPKTAAALIRFAGEQGSDLIVMGAFGHNSFSERLFGGVTRDLLSAHTISCFMSH